MYAATADSAPGDTTGDGREKLWHAVSTPFYNVVIRRRVVTEMLDAGGRTYPDLYRQR